MEQVNSRAMSMLQTMAAQTTDLPKIADNSDSDDFQKLLSQKAQDMKSDSKPSEEPRDDGKPSRIEPPKHQEEDGVARAKRLIAEGMVPVDLNGRQLIGIQPVIGKELTIQSVTMQPELMTDAADEMEVLTGSEVAEMIPAQILEEVETPVETQPQGIVADVPSEEAAAEGPAQEAAPVERAETVQPQQTHQTERTAEEQPVQTEETAQEDSDVKITGAEQAPRRIFEDVKAAPMKVGETYEAEQSKPVEQVARQVIQAIDRGESQVRIQLTPDSLGSVTVEISQNADGILHIALSAHSSETRNLLERHAADLQGLLVDHTKQTVQVEVQRQQESQQGQNQHPYDGHNGHNQGGQQQQHRREHTSSQDFFQQLRLGLIPIELDED